MLYDSPDLPVTFDSESAERDYAARIEEWRRDGRDMDVQDIPKGASNA